MKECALRARSTHGVHHAIVEVNIVNGVVLGEVLVARVVPLVVDAVIGLALSLIAHVVVVVVFVVAILHRIFLYGRYILYTRRAGTLLVDSGADDHICHPDFAKEFLLKKSAGVTVRDVQGNPLSHHGTRHVNLSVGTRGQRANSDFQIADISDNILSLGKLLRNGFVFNLRGENDSIMYHHRDPKTTVPFFLQEQLENSCEPDCTSCESGDGGRHACATVWSITVKTAGSSFG